MLVVQDTVICWPLINCSAPCSRCWVSRSIREIPLVVVVKQNVIRDLLSKINERFNRTQTKDHLKMLTHGQSHFTFIWCVKWYTSTITMIQVIGFHSSFALRIESYSPSRTCPTYRLLHCWFLFLSCVLCSNRCCQNTRREAIHWQRQSVWVV